MPSSNTRELACATRTKPSLMSLGRRSVSGLSLADELARRRLQRSMFDLDLPAVRVGRFVLERQLGAGGMGTVWAAQDEALERAVALKFLRDVGEDERARVYEEARALAKLSHPNVIPVYEVGVEDERVWIVMEWVRGNTLRALAQREQRVERAERLRCWLDAGRGLAAVHDAGLIHRDLKPDNVLLGEDGRVRLIDFGLVCAPTETKQLERSSLAPDSPGSNTLPLPRRGFAGTRAYAAPEQLACTALGAHADQYSFAVCVCEALTGIRPRDPRQLAALDGLRPRERRALARALAPEPSERHPSMAALITALEPPRGRRVLLTSVATGLAAAGLAVGLTSTMNTPDPCLDVSHALDELWTDTQRALMLERLPPHSGADTLAALDAWARAWDASASQSCEDSLISQVRSPLAHDRRMACLERRLASFTALAETSPAQLASSGLLARALAELEAPQDCLLEHVAEAELEPPSPALAEALELARKQLFSARIGVRPLSESIAITAQVELDAQQLERPLLAGEAARTRAILERRRGRSQAARTAAGRALDLARDHGALELEAKAWTSLFSVAQALEFDVEGAEWILGRRAAAVERMGAASRERALLLTERALLARMRDELPAALELLERADTQFAALGPLAAWDRATSLRDLSNTLSLAGRHEQAMAHLELARQLELQLGLDPSHGPAGARRASSLFEEALMQWELGHDDRALRGLEQALSAYVLEQGPRGPGVCQTHVALASFADARGDLRGAIEQLEQAQRIAATSHGAMSLDRAAVLSAVGTLAYRQGHYPDAIAAFERVLLIRSKREPEATINIALSQSNLAEALHAAGRTREASALLERALPQLEHDLGPEHGDLAYPLAASASVRLALDDASASLRAARRALLLFDEHSPDEAAASWTAAQAAARLGLREEAERYARRALASYTKLDDQQHIKIISSWLAESKSMPSSPE